MARYRLDRRASNAVRWVEQNMLPRRAHQRRQPFVPIPELRFDNGCRLSLSAAQTVAFGQQNGSFTSDGSTLNTTVYLIPYTSNLLSLYNGRAWSLYRVRHTGPQTTTVAIPSAGVYDIFAYWNTEATFGPQVSLEAVKWPSNQTRSTLLVRPVDLASPVDQYAASGVIVKDDSGSLEEGARYTRRYLGTVYYDATFKLCDTSARRYVWNLNNQIQKRLYQGISADSATTGYRTAASLEVVIGLQGPQPGVGYWYGPDVTAMVNASVSGEDSPTYQAYLINEIISSSPVLSSGPTQSPSASVQWGTTGGSRRTQIALRMTTGAQGLNKISFVHTSASGTTSASGQMHGMFMC